MRPLSLLWIAGFLPGIHGQPLQIRTTDLPWAIVRAAYSSRIAAVPDGRCPLGDVHLSLVAGSLPHGIGISGENLAGIATEIGTFRFAVRAANVCGSTQKSYQLVVTGKPILRVFPEAISIERHAGKVDPANLSVQVSASWPNLPYIIKNDAAWLTGKPASGLTPRYGLRAVVRRGVAGSERKGFATRYLSHLFKILDLVGNKLAYCRRHPDGPSLISNGAAQRQ
jgi:hypothetical protein